MLVSLPVRDVAQIKKIDLVLNSGFIALTEETGKRKSILIDENDNVKTTVAVLNENGRLEELYKISSGTHITDATIEAVVSLVDNQG